ncbi:MAG: polysaccharide deacetylase family protein [Kangiellaceae bacterium]|jgi:peptidoglycan/xylan/chitin deacetylase (PgdA/CDA1 family)|nr:polysaccharide deacetylase family protein [Kangiellaceae bacterium]
MKNVVLNKYLGSLAALAFYGYLMLYGEVACAQSEPDQTGQPPPEQQLTILMYHHISNATPKSTSTSPKQFRAHLSYLKRAGYKVMPLHYALERLYGFGYLPNKAVAITFDDGYSSVYENALPILKAFDMPFTVFVSTESVEQNYADVMSWQQLRELQRFKGTIASHFHQHQHLTSQPLYKVKANFFKSYDLLEEKLGPVTPVVAYPYGEYNLSIAEFFEQQGWYGVTQVSGPVSNYSNPQAIPRFSFSGNYANTDQFNLKLNTLSMPILNQESYNPVVPKGSNYVKLSAKFASLPFDDRAITCYYNDQLVPSTVWRERLLTLQAIVNIDERSRVNCTAPSSNKKRYYWHSFLLIPEEL